jgi:hypothetical protein
MKQRLEALTAQIEQELLETGTLVVWGDKIDRRVNSDNPYSGFCGYAVEKLKELAPDLDLTMVSFIVSKRHLGRNVNHAVAEIKTKEGEYIVDPTIKQFLPNAKSVYYPNEEYPILSVSKIRKRVL